MTEPTAAGMPPPDEVVFKGSEKLSEEFVATILESKLTADYRATMQQRGWRPLFDKGEELFYNGIRSPSGNARHAVIPLQSEDGGRLGYMYTYDPETGREGADIFQVIETAEDNRIRFFVEPSLTIAVDFVFAKNGTFVTVLAVGDTTDYLACFITRALLIAIGASGGNPAGAASACLAACAVITNPICLACIGVSLGIALAAWWDC